MNRDEFTYRHILVRYTSPIHQQINNTMDLQDYLDQLEESYNNFYLLYGILVRLSNIHMYDHFL